MKSRFDVLNGFKFYSFLAFALTVNISALAFAAPTEVGDPQEKPKLGFLEPAKIEKVIRSKIAQLTLKKDFDLFDVNVIDGINIGSNYSYKLSPAYYKNKFSRIDEWTLNANISPGQWLEDVDLPVGLSIGRGAKVTFARLFDSQIKAGTAIPYTIAHLPLTANVAQKRLQTGDFVAFQAHMNFVLSKGSSWPISDYLRFSAGASYVLSGQFLVHIFKIDEDKVRVKIIGLRGKNAGLSGNAHLSPDLELFGISILDNQVNRFFRLDLATLSGDVSRSDMYLVDYVMDLSKPEVALAYNSLMQAGLKLKSVKIANPFQSEDELNDELIHDIDAVDTIFKEDRGLPRMERRVDRVFEGKNNSHSSGKHFNVNLKAFQAGRQTVYSTNKIQSIERDDRQQNYLFNTYMKTKEHRFAFDFFRKKVNESMSVLLTANPDFSADRFKDLHFSVQIEDANFTKNNRHTMLRLLSRRLSAEVVSKLGIDFWLMADNKLQNNAYLKYDFIFSEKSLALVPDYSYIDLAQKIDEYLELYPELKAYMGWSSTMNYAEGSLPYNTSPAMKEEMAMTLSMAFDSQRTPSERMALFLKLRNNPLFYEIGPGFLASLVPENERMNTINVHLQAGAKEISPFDQMIGTKLDRELYNTVQYIQSVLNNRSQDLSLTVDDSGEARAQ